MTENNAAQPGLTTEQILSLERRGNMTDDEALRFGRAIESALLSKLRAEGVQAGELPAHIIDDSHPLQYRLGWNNCLSDCRAALASAPLAGEADNTDYIGLALELESAAKRVESQTVQRAIEAGAHGLRLAYSFRNAAPQASEAVRNTSLIGLLLRAQAWMATTRGANRPNNLIRLIDEALKSQAKVDRDSAVDKSSNPQGLQVDRSADLQRRRGCATCRGTGEVANLPSWPSLQVCGNGPVWKKCPDCGDCAKGAAAQKQGDSDA